MAATPRPRLLVTIPMFAEVLAHLGQQFEVDAPCGTANHIDWTPDTLAARAQGCWLLGPLLAVATLGIGQAIVWASALGYLGLGAPPPEPEWGAMLNEARADMVMAPHVALFPAIAIFLTVLAFNLLGDGLRDALDPKIKG